MNRRQLLIGSGLMAGASVWARAVRAQSSAGQPPQVFVLLFLRGALDGLGAVPLVDAQLGRLRPGIALPPKRPLSLDAGLGLHPALAPLLPLYKEKSLLLLHQAGSPDPTRSHFDAQDYAEAGAPGDKTAEGVLTRVLAMLPRQERGLRAVALEPTLPRSMAGSPEALAFDSLRDLGASAARTTAHGTFESMYAGALDEALRGAGREAFEALRSFDQRVKRAPNNAEDYPKGPLGRHLADIAQLVRADVGLAVAATESGGFDTHVNQGQEEGVLARRLTELGGCLAAFARDLGPAMERVTLLAMTEFGRTVKENGSGGTDHGHGSVMFLLGGGVRGGRVIGAPRSLAEADLFEGRDLPVKTDFRAVLGETFHQLWGVDDRSLFPGFTRSSALGLFRRA
ncbi:MAG: DUF1501 domain-containing protein [Myxococcota bacterium]